MNRSRIWLAIPVACLAAASTTAAPVPVRALPSQGPISDALGLRGKFPTTAPPLVTKVAMADESTLEVQHRVFRYEVRTETLNQVEYVQEVRQKTVQRDGQDVKVQYVVAVPVTRQVAVQRAVRVPSAEVRKESVAAKDCKFFAVTGEGKLEPVEARKAATLLKKPTSVLTGTSAEVDPRHLELIRPGTIYVVLPSPKPAPPPEPGKKPRVDD